MKQTNCQTRDFFTRSPFSASLTPPFLPHLSYSTSPIFPFASRLGLLAPVLPSFAHQPFGLKCFESCNHLTGLLVLKWRLWFTLRRIGNRPKLCNEAQLGAMQGVASVCAGIGRVLAASTDYGLLPIISASRRFPAYLRVSFHVFQSWFYVGVARIMLLDAFGMKGDVGRCRQRMAGCFDIFACFCLEGWPYTSCYVLPGLCSL